MQNFFSNIVANDWLRASGGLLSLIVLAWMANIVTRRVFLGFSHKLMSRTRSTWDDRLFERRVFHQLASMAPALVVYVGIDWALSIGDSAFGRTGSSVTGNGVLA